MRMMLDGFQDGLSRNLQYSSRNTETHIMYKTTLAPYTVMHVVYFLSVIVLHRAYIPFLPLRCSEPVGPLDEPTFPGDKGMPEGFWRDSARELCRAARQMIDLAVTCQERGVLVENPLIGFAIYNAAFISIYATHFPQMDPDGSLSAKASDSPQGKTHTRKALDILLEMRPRLKMAVGWFRTLNRLNSYFSKVKRDFKRPSRKLDVMPDHSDPHVNGLRPIREGGTGGGLEEFKVLEKLFLDFGSIEDQLPEHQEEDRATNISDSGSNAVKSEPEAGELQLDGAGGRRESWVPINHAGMPPPPDRERRPSLPLPQARSLQSTSPFPLPPLQNHPDAPLFHTSSPPSLPPLSPAVSYPAATQSPSQYATAPSNRLQPLNSWVTNRQPPPPYSQALPPINAATSQSLPFLPPPGSVSHPAASPPLTDSADQNLWSTSLVGDDVLAFLEGSEWDRSSLSMMTPSEVGVPAGWLSTVWGTFGRQST